MIFWGLADYQVSEIIEVFADLARTPREDAARLPLGRARLAEILEVVPVELEFSAN